MTKRMAHHLTIYRRHAGKCPIKGLPPKFDDDRCQCPLWVHGKLHGKFVQQSLNTRDLVPAKLKKAQLLEGPATPPPGVTSIAPRADVTVEEAAADYLAVKTKKSAPSTISSYTLAVNHFAAYAVAKERPYLRQIDTPLVQQYFNEYDSEWEASYAQQRLKNLRVFFNYCRKPSKRWITESPAADEDLNYDVAESTRAPFEPEQVTAILEAVERLPEAERDRARALVLLMLHTGMRMCDAAFFERDYVKQVDQASCADYYAIKNKRRILTPPEIAPSALAALDKLPASRVYYFQPDRDDDYNEARQALKKRGHFAKFLPDYTRRVCKQMRLVLRVLDLAGIAYGNGDGACHRFRHTFAVNMLTTDAHPWVVSRMLGHKDTKTLDKHYANLVNSYRYKLSHYTRKLNYAIPA